MELSSYMSAQVAQLQQTVQMSIMNKSLNMGAASSIQMLEQLPEQQPAAQHPHKGSIIDVSV
ncbi:putative motility protein [Ureibacillus sinduriensis]|uniref:Polyribonucleotide nucleotidyltransferase n=1 Tax=Ureibacillus sinduriensis BLB-1 = JCM 15800 TaxID=1384057 RepID=A0A0A3HUB1_9BACL|nr:YjfB family protein [Ureibacillus sinduriensis]KGR76044.1 polyribonucleotide nucleotidyltransferase [Ureibacillus sinduriensis BLB-1 = JCM 15800]